MNCVDGHGPMLERRIAGQVVDQCEVCQGLWLDPGELWRALERPVSDEDNLRRHLVFEGLNMARDCPRCSTPLSNATVGPIVLSACMDCTGLWLDDGARASLATYRPTPVAPPPPVSSGKPIAQDPYDEGEDSRPMTVYGTAAGQTEARVRDVGLVMESLVDVLFAVIRGVVPD